MLAVIAAGCERQATMPPVASTSPGRACTYEIVQPDKSAEAQAFRAWLTLQEDDLFFDQHAIDRGDVFIADLDNDGRSEALFAAHEGSGNYLYAKIFRRVSGKWAEDEHSPLEDRLRGSHEYSGPLLTEPQLVARLCGKTIFNFMGGDEPNYYPDSVIWEDNAVRQVCSGPWLTHHRSAAADLAKRTMLDEALVLLNGISDSCEQHPSPELRVIKDDIAGITAVTTAASADTYDFSWVMREVTTHPDNQLVLDPRFGQMLVAILPNADLDGESLRGALKKSVWLPDDPRIIDDRYVVIAGCEPHNCSNRGFVWIDTQTKQAIGMTGGVLASRNIDPARIPPAFWSHIRTVGGLPTDGPIAFIGADGRKSTVKAP